MIDNPVHHRYTKHIKIDIQLVREKVMLGEVRVLHVPLKALVWFWIIDETLGTNLWL